MPNPYKAPDEATPRHELADLADDTFEKQLAASFVREGFVLEHGVSTSFADCICVVSRRQSLFPIPRLFRIYLYRLDQGTRHPLDMFLELDRLSVRTTDKRYSVPTWLRFDVPTSLTIAVSANGFCTRAVEEIQNKKLKRQSGHPHALVLVDRVKQQVFCLNRLGQSRNLNESHELTLRLIREALIKKLTQ